MVEVETKVTKLPAEQIEQYERAIRAVEWKGVVELHAELTAAKQARKEQRSVKAGLATAMAALVNWAIKTHQSDAADAIEATLVKLGYKVEYTKPHGFIKATLR